MMMDCREVLSDDIANNFALGYIVLAQLHLRNNNLNVAHECLRRSIGALLSYLSVGLMCDKDLQQHRYQEIVATLQDIHYRYIFGCDSKR